MRVVTLSLAVPAYRAHLTLRGDLREILDRRLFGQQKWRVSGGELGTVPGADRPARSGPPAEY